MNKFVITIPVYNAEKYIERCLNSALTQNFSSNRFNIVVIDDASTDRTDDEITKAITNQLVRSGAFACSVKRYRNRKRMGALSNHITMANLCCDDDIIVNLDGDDQLSHEDVLSILDEVYKDPEVWMTYGSYAYDFESRGPSGDYMGFSAQIPSDNHTRQMGWSASHLRTYQAWLFKRIRLQHLMIQEDDYYPISCDLATMYPMIEMSGPKHARFLSDVLYLYNAVNPINDHKVFDSEEAAKVRAHIQARKIYPQLTERLGSPVW